MRPFFCADDAKLTVSEKYDIITMASGALRTAGRRNMNYTLLTGACGGLGGAFAELLAGRGEPLFLTGRSRTRLNVLADSLSERYPHLPVECYPCDLTDSAQRQALFDYADEKSIGFSRLVYVAGVDIQKASERYTEAKIVLQARVNLEAAVSLTRYAMGRCPMNGTAEFLAIGSMSSSCPMPYFALYSATKKALEQYYVALHSELKGRAKVTVVLPGSIPTREDIKENIRTHGIIGRLSAKPPQAVAKAALKAVARNRRKKVIGFWNHIIYGATRLAPLSWKLSYVARHWSKTEKDAF